MLFALLNLKSFVCHFTWKKYHVLLILNVVRISFVRIDSAEVPLKWGRYKRVPFEYEENKSVGMKKKVFFGIEDFWFMSSDAAFPPPFSCNPPTPNPTLENKIGSLLTTLVFYFLGRRYKIVNSSEQTTSSYERVVLMILVV